jgi:3-dehydroquinate dehydratase-1
VDIEMCNEPDFIASVRETAKKFKTRLILSYHNFNDTPNETFIQDRLSRAQQLGADIAKVAVMPKNYADVLTLLNATLKARSGAVKVPIVTMSMGAAGGVTRLVGGLFGSDITFAIGKKASAPGQIPIAKLRQAMSVLYK